MGETEHRREDVEFRRQKRDDRSLIIVHLSPVQDDSRHVERIPNPIMENNIAAAAAAAAASHLLYFERLIY